MLSFRRFARALTAAALGCVMGGLGSTAVITPANLRKEAPAFVLEGADGAPVRLSDLKGKVVLLDFWATWCHGCKEEIPWFMEFQTRHKAKGLAVLGVSMDSDGWKSVRPYLKQKPINYPIVIGNETLAKSYGQSSMPMTYLIDRDGKIAVTYEGMVDRATCEKHLLVLLTGG